MGILLAKEEEGSLDHDPTSSYDATIVHVDDTRSIVWLWIPKLHKLQVETNEDDFYVWNPEFQASQIVKLAKLDPSFRYQGLVRLAVDSEPFSRQRSSIDFQEVLPPIWPDTGATLQEVVDSINTDDASKGTLQVLTAIALQASSQNDDLLRHGSLSAWLASTAPTRGVDLANPSVFAEAMRQRSHLFAELASLMTERRIVFLLGDKQSYLPEFIDGFQDFIQKGRCENLTHVTASFKRDDFQQILNQCSALLPVAYAVLDCLLASLAYAATRGLKQTAGKFLPSVFLPEMEGRPVDFARAYLRNAPQHEEYWQCIRNFLNFLNNAVTVSGTNGKITVFLPFYTVEEVINGDADTRRQLWEGIDALRQRLKDQPEDCPHLGLVLAAHDLPIEREPPKSIRHAVLRIPPLSRAELGELLRLFWGGQVSQAELDSLDDYSGGDPWFVFLMFRCLKSIIEVRRKEGKQVQRDDVITMACNLARSAVLGDGSESIPPDVRGDVNVYFIECKSILWQYRSAIETRIVLQAWEYPESYYSQRREIAEFERPWIRTGLVYPQAVKTTRGESLRSLIEYPRYQFCKAGTLPLAFAERVLKVAKRPRGQ